MRGAVSEEIINIIDYIKPTTTHEVTHRVTDPLKELTTMSGPTYQTYVDVNTVPVQT